MKNAKAGACGFENSRGYVKHFCNTLAGEGLDAGFKMLVAARCGGLWTAQRAAKRGLILPVFENKCPCCNTNTQEDLTHLLLSCTAWHTQRQTYLAELVAAHHVSPACMVTLLLGGVANGYSVPHWADETPAYVKVVRFMQVISAKRHLAIWQHSTKEESRSPVGYGSPADSSDEG